jgi:hypothetical protein
VLYYESAERRSERMAGGVPAWTWTELGPMVRDLDALYLNFISGFELALGTAEALRHGFAGPIYADFHSLMLGMHGDGIRELRPLRDAPSWFGCFDVIQVNEEEMSQLGPDPLSLAAAMLGLGVAALIVTLGARGAVYVAGSAAVRPCGSAAVGQRGGGAVGDPVRTALVPAEPVLEPLDPTVRRCLRRRGVSRLLAGEPLRSGRGGQSSRRAQRLPSGAWDWRNTCAASWWRPDACRPRAGIAG